jgi:hypothetical protein
VKPQGYKFEMEFRNFASEASLMEYISSPDYLTQEPGVCFGFSVSEVSDKNWTASLYFDDSGALGTGSLQAIPSLSQNLHSSLQSAPKLDDYEKYQVNGYALVQNLLANLLLREVTQT